mmetsp:Transcript_30012/g.68160  ORF Transcript_30012/g.68160 Transcript_30012/m.68160 type:complete len:207 (-) Transcript_30012:1758-2378(-)
MASDIFLGRHMKPELPTTGADMVEEGDPGKDFSLGSEVADRDLRRRGRGEARAAAAAAVSYSSIRSSFSFSRSRLRCVATASCMCMGTSSMRYINSTLKPSKMCSRRTIATSLPRSRTRCLLMKVGMICAKALDTMTSKKQLVMTERKATISRQLCQDPMEERCSRGGRLHSVSLNISTLDSNRLLSRARAGARGKATTNMVTYPY